MFIIFLEQKFSYFKEDREHRLKHISNLNISYVIILILFKYDGVSENNGTGAIE